FRHFTGPSRTMPSSSMRSRSTFRMKCMIASEVSFWRREAYPASGRSPRREAASAAGLTGSAGIVRHSSTPNGVHEKSRDARHPATHHGPVRVPLIESWPPWGAAVSTRGSAAREPARNLTTQRQTSAFTLRCKVLLSRHPPTSAGIGRQARGLDRRLDNGSLQSEVQLEVLRAVLAVLIP